MSQDRREELIRLLQERSQQQVSQPAGNRDAMRAELLRQLSNRQSQNAAPPPPQAPNIQQRAVRDAMRRPDARFLHPEEIRQDIERRVQLMGGQSPQAASNQSVAQATASEMPIRAGVTRFADTAQSTVTGATNALGVTDRENSAQRQVGQAFAEQRPITGMGTDIAGMIADPVWLGAFGAGGMALRGLANAGRLGNVGTRLGQTAQQGGIRGFAAREAFDATAGAGADIARAAIGEQRMATAGEMATGAALGAGGSAILQGVGAGARAASRGVQARRAAAEQAEREVAEAALRRERLRRDGIDVDSEGRIPLAEGRIADPPIQHQFPVQRGRATDPNAIPVARSERPTFELDRSGLRAYGRQHTRRFPEEARSEPQPLETRTPPTRREQFQDRMEQSRQPRRQPEPTPTEQTRQQVARTARPEPDATVDGLPAFNSRAAAQRYADTINTGRVPGEPPATVEGSGGVVPYIVRNAETDVPLGPPRTQGPQTDMPIQGVRRPDTGMERFQQRQRASQQSATPGGESVQTPSTPQPVRPNAVQTPEPRMIPEQPQRASDILATEREPAQRFTDAARARFLQRQDVVEELDALVESGFSRAEAERMVLQDAPTSTPGTGVLSGTEQVRIDPRRGGFVNVEPIVQSVNAAIRSGKWAANNTAEAARWLYATAGEKVRNLADATLELVRQFGESIRPMAQEIYRSFQGFMLSVNTPGSGRNIGAVNVGAARKIHHGFDYTVASRDKARQSLSGEEGRQIARVTGDPKMPQKIADSAENVVDEIADFPSFSGFTPQPAIEISSVAGRAGREAVSAVDNWAFRDIIDRLGSSSNDPVTQQAAQAARRAVDAAKEITLGELRQPLDAILRTVGTNPLGQQGRTISNMQRVEYDANGAGHTRFRRAIEGRIPESQLTATERKVVQEYQQFLRKTGDVIEREGIQQYNHRTGEWQQFTSRDRAVAPRLSTSELFDITLVGEGPRFDALASHIARLNNQPVDVVRQVMQRQRNDMLGIGGDASSFRRMNAEFTRVWREFPDYMRDPETGAVIPLLESNPFTYAERVAGNVGNRVGYVRHFGQNVPGQQNLEVNIADMLQRQPANSDAILSVTRALNGMPVERAFYTQPGTGLHEIGRIAGHLSHLTKSSMLAPTFVPNMFEPLGNIQALAGGPGGRDLWVALRRLFPGTESRHATSAALEEIGALSHWIRNWSWNPNRPGESAARIMGEINTSLPRIFWRSQERFAGAVGLAKAERMAAGKGTRGDITDLRAMGYTREAAERIARGKGTPDEYASIPRRAGAFTTNSPMARSEVSRLEHNRAFRAATAFTQYAFMKVRNFASYSKVATEDIARVARNPNDKEAWSQAIASSSKIARVMAGTTVSGMGSHLMLSFLTGGKLGLQMSLQEAKENPFNFIRDSFLYTMFAGPFGAILRQAGQGNNLGDTLLNMTWPGAIANEMLQFSSGQGKYRDLNFWEKMGKFGDRFVPINRMGMQALAAWGMGGEDMGYKTGQRRMDTAISGYWRAMRDIDPQGRFRPSNRTSGVESIAQQRELDRKFRKNMRQAYRAIKNGQNPSDYIREALQADPRDSREVASSIRNRRLLPVFTGRETPDRMRQKIDALKTLERRIGPEAMELLRQHDALLEAWAQAVLR